MRTKYLHRPITVVGDLELDALTALVKCYGLLLQDDGTGGPVPRELGHVDGWERIRWRDRKERAIQSGGEITIFSADGIMHGDQKYST